MIVQITVGNNPKEIDEVVHSQLNGLSKSNKVAVKKLTENKDVNSVQNIIKNERADKAPSGEKPVFIVRGSIIKHKNGYEISGKLEIAKFLLDHLIEQQSDAWKTMLNRFYRKIQMRLFFTLERTIYHLEKETKI